MEAEGPSPQQQILQALEDVVLLKNLCRTFPEAIVSSHALNVACQKGLPRAIEVLLAVSTQEQVHFVGL